MSIDTCQMLTVTCQMSPVHFQSVEPKKKVVKYTKYSISKITKTLGNGFDPLRYEVNPHKIL